MTASCRDEFDWGSDCYRRHIPSDRIIDSRSPIILNIEQESIARDLHIHMLDKDVFNHERRARMIHQYVEWILNDKEDLGIKQIAWFSK